MEIIPKPIEKPPLLQSILFYFSILFLVGAIGSYFVFCSLIKNKENLLKNLEEKINQAKTPEIKSLEKEIFGDKERVGYQKKIEDFAKIFNSHRFNSKLFTFLEEKTYPKVFFSKLSFDSQNFEVSLSGLADSFQSLDYQIQIFQKEDLIKKLNLSKISIGKGGGLEFTLDLIIDPKIISW